MSRGGFGGAARSSSSVQQQPWAGAGWTPMGVSATPSVWPNHEWQLATIYDEDGVEKLGCRIVTSGKAGAAIQKVFEDNRLPSALDDKDPEIGSDDVVYIYLDGIHYPRAQFLLQSKVKSQKIHPLPPELCDLLKISQENRAAQESQDAKTHSPTAQPPPAKDTHKRSKPDSKSPPSKDTHKRSKPGSEADSKESAQRTTSRPTTAKTHPKPDHKSDHKQDPKVDSKNDSKSKNESTSESKSESESESKVDSKSDEEPPSAEIPKQLWGLMKSYQRAAVRKFQRLSGRLLLADDPGLGKTLQAIVCATLHRKRWPVLVVCPSSVKANWRGEFCKWLGSTGLRPRDVKIIETQADALRFLPSPSDSDIATAASLPKAPPGFKRQRRPKPKNAPKPGSKPRAKSKSNSGATPGAVKAAPAVSSETYEVYIVSYDLLIRPRVYERVVAKRFKVLISDESHFLRNPTAQRTITFTGLSMKAPHVLELTGTPGFCPEQVFAMVRALQPNLLPPFWLAPPAHINTQDKLRAAQHELPCTYGSRWCDPHPEPTFAGKYTWVLNGGCRLHELNAILREFVLLKRTKEEVLKELPEKVRQPIHFEVPLKDRQIIETEMNAIKGLRQTKPLEFKARFMKLWNDLPRVKLPAVKEYLATLFTTGDIGVSKTEKILLFGHHKAMIEGIEEVVRAHKLKYIKITGNTPTPKRQPLVDEFQTDPEVRVAILSLTAAGFGLNLQAASKVVMCEIFFGPDVQVQAEDRVHRLGQKASQVLCRYLVAKSTLDEGLLRMLTRKTMSGSSMLLGRRDKFAMKRAEHLTLSTDEPEEITDSQIEDPALDALIEEPDALLDEPSEPTTNSTHTSSTHK